MTRVIWKLLALTVLASVLAGWSVANAQQTSFVSGDYVGTLGPLSLKLHIQAAPDGMLSGTLDSPNQSAHGIPCSDFLVEGATLSFKVPAVNGTWKGSIEEGGAKLSGTWSQGAPMPLVFTRDTFVPAAKPSAIDGIWLGTVQQADGRAMRTQIIVKSDAKGAHYCSIDSVDAFAYDIACTNAKLSADQLSFEVPPVNGRWTGTLSKDGNTLTGTWAQEKSALAPAAAPAALDFTRQTQRLSPANAFPVTYDDPVDPVSAAHMEAVLRRDLGKTQSGGVLSDSSPIGVAIGVIRDGERRVFTIGKVKPDAMFEIGSITKTFTGLLLAQAIEQGTVQSDTPVRELLPKDLIAKPTAGSEITLLDLATQHSGLPRMPSNFWPTDPSNPYVDYDSKLLYDFIRQHGVVKPNPTQFQYSNLGLGLLGQALANRANVDYSALLERSVLEPLGMQDTTIALSAEQQRRFAQGHGADRRPAHAWDIAALVGAGGIRSTAAEMLTYLEANLRQRAAKAATTADGRTLAAALKRSQTPQADVGGNLKIAFAWMYDTATEMYWHSGGTGGYSSFAFFNPKRNYAGVVLVNMELSPRGSFADTVGNHICARFAGEKAVSLRDW